MQVALSAGMYLLHLYLHPKPHQTTPPQTIPQHTTPLHTTPHHTTPHRIILAHSTSHHTTPHHTAVPHTDTPLQTQTPHQWSPMRWHRGRGRASWRGQGAAGNWRHWSFRSGLADGLICRFHAPRYTRVVPAASAPRCQPAHQTLGFGSTFVDVFACMRGRQVW